MRRFPVILLPISLMPSVAMAGVVGTVSLPNIALILLLGVLMLAVAVMILRRISQLQSALKHGYAGAQLQTKVVKAFSLITIIPTLVISIFSITFFYYGAKDWFNDRISTVLSESVAVAEAYVQEHESTLRADAMAMANDLRHDLEQVVVNPPRFNEILNGQVALRSLSEAIVLQQDQVIARSLLSFSLSFESLPERILQIARNGEVAIMEKEDRIFAVVVIDPFTDTYLVISRLVDGKVIEHIEQSKGAAARYQRMLNTADQLQMLFVTVFILVTLGLLLSVIWYGINFASRITRPLITVAQATERVRAGDYSIRIEEDTDNDEMDMLIRHFNRMTEQLYTGRLELTQVTRMLDQRRRFSESVLSGVSAGVIALDTNLVVSLSNSSALELLGFSSEKEMTGRSLRSLLPEFSPLLTRVLLHPGDIHEDQITLMRHGQSTVLHVRVSAEISQNYVEGFIVTLDDITPLISAQRSAAWSDVARRVAHEIKNPLTPIKLSVDRLKKKFAPDDPKARESFEKYLETITRHLRDIGTIVEEFSSFARMPAPKLAQLPLVPLLEAAIFSAETSKPDIEFTLEVEDRKLMLECDESQISQVLTNILKNAAESIGRREQPEEPGAIAVTCDVSGNQIVVAIADNGVGFPEELIHKIMEPYVTTRAKGTGLGLAIVKKIIEDHKGTITVANRVEGGAVVTLTFPSG